MFDYSLFLHHGSRRVEELKTCSFLTFSPTCCDINRLSVSWCIVDNASGTREERLSIKETRRLLQYELEKLFYYTTKNVFDKTKATIRKYDATCLYLEAISSDRGSGGKKAHPCPSPHNLEGVSSSFNCLAKEPGSWLKRLLTRWDTAKLTLQHLHRLCDREGALCVAVDRVWHLVCEAWASLQRRRPLPVSFETPWTLMGEGRGQVEVDLSVLVCQPLIHCLSGANRGIDTV